jgi:hypothetical protein
MLRLQNSAMNTTCPICHVFFAALKPFVVSADETLLANTAMVAFEGEHEDTVQIFPQEGHAVFATTVDRHRNPRGLPIDPLYSAKLYSNRGKCILIHDSHRTLCNIRSKTQRALTMVLKKALGM